MKPDAPAPEADRTAHFLRLIEASRGSRAAEVWYEFKTGKTATVERPAAGGSDASRPPSQPGASGTERR